MKQYTVAFLLLLVIPLAHADWGINSIRVACTEGSIAFEPFVAWNDGNSPYKEFSGEDARDLRVVSGNSGVFYSLEPGYAAGICFSKSRRIQFMIIRPAGEWLLTIVEDGEVAVDAYGFERAYGGNTVLTINSASSSKWEACESRIVNQITSPKVCSKVLGPKVSRRP